MTIILNQWNEATRGKVARGASYKEKFEAGELIKFLARVHTVSNVTNDGNVLFGSWVTKITEHHFWPTLFVKELLSAHPTDDAIWDNTNTCNISFNTEDNAEIITSIHITKESTFTCYKFDSQDLLPVTVSMSHDDDDSWFDAHKDFDLWHNTSKPMDNYNEWDQPPNICDVIGVISNSIIGWVCWQ